MARTKIRKYPSIKAIENIVNEYFNSHSEEVISAMLEHFGFDSTDSLWDYEYLHNGMGCDCGFVWLKPTRNEHQHEWVLDDDLGGYGAYASRFNYPYQTQSTKIKEFELRYALNALEGNDDYYITIRLD